MKRRMLTIAVFVLASMSASDAVYAAPVAVRVPVQAMFAKSKLVSFNVRNDTAAPLKLRCGESVMTVDAGKTMDLHLPVGAKVVTEEAAGTTAPGTVIAQVSNELKGTTIAIR